MIPLDMICFINEKIHKYNVSHGSGIPEFRTKEKYSCLHLISLPVDQLCISLGFVGLDALVLKRKFFSQGT
jgi:hypothetical protein